MKKIRNPWSLGPLRIQAEAWEEIEPTYRERDGKKPRRFRLRSTDIIGVEDPMDPLFEIGGVNPCPMKAPLGNIFFLGWKNPSDGTPKNGA